MNKILEATLKVAEAVAISTVPGAAVVDKVVHDAIDHKVTASEVPDLAQAVIQVVESFKGADIADEIKFRAAVADLESAFKLLAESLKHS